MGDAPEESDPLEEIVERYLAEKPVHLEAFLARYPQHADELRELLPALQMLEERGRVLTSDSSEGPTPTTSRWLERWREEQGSLGEPLRSSRNVPGTLTEYVRELLARVRAHGYREERFQIEGELARGGQGVVLVVWDETLRRHLAMKVARTPSSSGKTDQASETRSLGRFLEEAQVTAQLDHPGIVPIHDLGLDSGGRAFFTMKLIKGRDLGAVFDLVQRGEEGWSRTRALGVVLKVCEAMAYAHSKGVIHRDLKPSNVMVGKFGEVYVMDWGLARMLARGGEKARPRPARLVGAAGGEPESDGPLVTMEGDVVGTPAFMSPEQARGDFAAMGPHSDVYAVGAMLYQLLTGGMPYVPGVHGRDNLALLEQVRLGPPVPVDRQARDVSPELTAICEKAMAREIASRYPDMGGLAEDLRAYLEHRVVRAYEAGPIAELRKWMRRNRTLTGVGALGLLALVGGLLSSLVLKRASDQNARQAAAERTSVMQLSVFQDLAELEKLADELWPAAPEKIPAYRDWLQRARGLVAGLDADPSRGDIGHRARLETLRARALPYTNEDRETDRASHPRRGELELVQARLRDLDQADAVRRGTAEVPRIELGEGETSLDASALNELAWARVAPDKNQPGQVPSGLAYARAATAREARSPSDRANFLDTLAWALLASGKDDEAKATSEAALSAAPEELKGQFEDSRAGIAAGVRSALSGATRARLERELAELDAEVGARRTWRFEVREDRWWHTQVEALVEALQSLSDPVSGLIDGSSARHGWGVARRLAWAERIEEDSVAGEEAAGRWRDAIASIADPLQSPAYDSLVIEPQLGLLPIGRDPSSGLWEFAHLATGDPARRDPGGQVVLTDETGLVLVLLPGGMSWMGAQKTDPEGPNYDPGSEARDGPVHRVTLSPFFLSKYEMTQGQWAHFAGGSPSFHQLSLLHPVEMISWIDCNRILPRCDLRLPREAEWEYGARGGTSTPWWTGRDRESLRRCVNLADQAAIRAGLTWEHGNDWPELDDGYSQHAPVDAFAANPFGLYSVHGNIVEWCEDAFSWNHSLLSQKDPVAKVEPYSRTSVVVRGGGFTLSAKWARSSFRADAPAEVHTSYLGVRPARSLTGRVGRQQ